MQVGRGGKGHKASIGSIKFSAVLFTEVGKRSRREGLGTRHATHTRSCVRGPGLPSAGPRTSV